MLRRISLQCLRTREGVRSGRQMVCKVFIEALKISFDLRVFADIEGRKGRQRLHVKECEIDVKRREQVVYAAALKEVAIRIVECGAWRV